MSSADLEFQKLLFARITAQLTAGALSATVTAHAKTGEPLPYIEIGESSLADHTIGHEMDLIIHVWSSGQGPAEAKRLQQAVRSAIHDTQAGEVLISDEAAFRFTCWREEYTTLFIDRDAKHWHGVQRYRVLASSRDVSPAELLVFGEADALAFDFTAE